MATYALIQNEIIHNIIVADENWVTQYCEENDFVAIDIDSISNVIEIGYIRKGNSYFPPEEISTNHDKISPNGIAATVTYTDNRSSTPSSVDGNANGQPFTLNLVNGKGSIDITSTTPNDIVTVIIGNVSINIYVMEA